ncbi:MAG: TonB-dependent receptor [Candidatus Nitrohelix vancouverensis]|uniref:TonB-dependent receptor n=1 Tax=Candidatus Nitrohelix vancouverensis TaxID=2705534 RepID=A0A7T0C306_9BACT|nr:MAG: TonB-dependent receptor [Candidatus Nitrohelix vancouverensis]
MTRSFYKTLAVSCLLVSSLNSHIAIAEDGPVWLEPKTITSTRINTNTDQFAGSATVITAKEIKESGRTMVRDILADHLSIDALQSGGIGTSSTLLMRGGNSDSTLVMIDGVQVNSNTLGSYNFGNINIDNIERIEILRGPQSTVWGADAVGGVIHIITKRGKGAPKTTFQFEGGSYSTFKESLNSSGSHGKLNYAVSASKTDSGSISAVSGERFGATEADGYENKTVSTRVGYDFENDLRVEFIGRYSSSQLDLDNFEADNGVRQSSEETFNVSLPVSKSITDWWDFSFRPSYFYDVGRDSQSGATPSKEDQIYNRNLTFEVQNNIQLGDITSVVIGGEYQMLTGHNVLNGFNHDNHNFGAFFQTQLNFNDTYLLSGGFRQDIHSEFENALTWKVEGAYKIHQTDTKLHGAYATGFKAPTFNQQFFPNFGTAGLKPEESRSWEFGVKQSFLGNRITTDITYFEMRFNNLIESIDTGGFVFRARNVGKAKTNGVETSLQALLPLDARLNLNYTWLEARDEDGTQLQRRARNKVSASISRTFFDKFDALLGVRYRSGVRTNSSGTKEVDTFTLLRTAFKYQLAKDLEITARIENLLDENYEEIFGFGTPGRAGYAGFNFTF